MTKIKIDRIKNDMEEAHVIITCEFVYSKSKDDIFRIREDFENLIARFAI